MTEDEIKRGVYKEDYRDITGVDWDGDDYQELYDFVDERQNKGLYYE
jgi:hypothetical protein